jgi:hypothetical protein
LQQLPDGGQIHAAIAVGQKPVMADAHKALGQAVEQEAPDELDGRKRRRFGAIFLSIFIGKSDHPVARGLDVAVGDCHAVGIAGQVCEHMEICLLTTLFNPKERFAGSYFFLRYLDLETLQC